MAKGLISIITFRIFDGNVKVFLVVLDAVGEERFVICPKAYKVEVAVRRKRAKK
jgi:hypothetical protein